MACDSVLKPGQNIVARNREIGLALERLEAGLKAGTVTIGISPQGAIVFKSWGAVDRDGVTDACAYRRLTSKSSWALRQAVAKAEAQAGRKVNAQAIAAGVHSHDGGRTWGAH